MTKHPAAYSKRILEQLEEIIHAARDEMGSIKVLDPFAGTGKIHLLSGDGLQTYGVEIEPEWAEMHPRTTVGNALDLPFEAGFFDLVVTSPTYGNRFADHHNAKDGSLRRSYTHDIGRQLHPDNSGTLHFGNKYKEFHIKAWREVYRVLKPGGWFVLNVSDFIRKQEVVNVVQWHLDHLVTYGFDVIADYQIDTPRMRLGQNSKMRVAHERIIVLRKDRPR